MDKPSHVIAELIDDGMTEQEIANRISSMGITVSQSTIHRIKTGEIAQPKFHLGSAIFLLRDQISASSQA